MPTVTFPYETLKRLRLVSLEPLVLELAGQHVKFRTIVTDDAGAVISDMESEAKAVSVGESAGLKLEDFEPAFHAAALRTVEQREATISAKEKEQTAALAAKDAELAAKTEEHAEAISAKDAELGAKSAALKETGDHIDELSNAFTVQFDRAERAEAEITELKMPEEAKRKANIQAEIDRLQVELGPVAGKGVG